MTNNEFILWLKGFTEGVHEYNITPKQWDLLKERLSEVDDENRTQTVHNVPAVTTSEYISASYIGHPTTTTMPLSATITYTTSGGPNWYATYFNDLKTDDNDR